MPSRPRFLRAGDLIRYDGRLHTVAALEGAAARLVDENQSPSVVFLAHLLLTMLNQREHGARRGMIVSGEWTTGKTTALKQLGRLHELRIRQRFPSSDRLPVFYITAPPRGSPRKLAMEFARFLGLPLISPRHNTTDVTSAVSQVMIEARTNLVLVDEIHLMNLATTAGEELSDHRSILVRTGPFPLTAEWRSLVATLENTLRLHRHEKGVLVHQADYLHHRTGGMVGSLSHLIRAAAITAILDGSERITGSTLKSIRIDHHNESNSGSSALSRNAAG